MVEYYDSEADWSLIPEHMHGGVKRYVMRGVPPGSFLTAILSNDFMEAAGRADDENLRALAGWATFLYNFVPAIAKGSPERVSEWIEAGGMEGWRAKQAAAKAEERA